MFNISLTHEEAILLCQALTCHGAYIEKQSSQDLFFDAKSRIKQIDKLHDKIYERWYEAEKHRCPFAKGE